ncbi:hypothetical protein CK203_049112 [Vitis vinifera]|uniref:Uncharacterized protein n=1 Tax=Vitis vinifera TaxID=29760 RepID=A0A438HC59_VITVI|nr:hypothetical protein CK203_049112 [Vitis vinifera]
MSKHSSEWNGRALQSKFPSIGAELALASDYFFRSYFSWNLGLGKWWLRLLRFCLRRRRWHRRWNWQGLGEGTGDSTGVGTGNVSPPALAALASLEELLSAAKAQERDPELAPFAGSSCGLKERTTWPLWFAPFRVAEIWPKLMIGEDDRRLAR